MAGLLHAADDGDESAEAELARRHTDDDRLHPGAVVLSHSPAGGEYRVDLTTRESTPM